MARTFILFLQAIMLTLGLSASAAPPDLTNGEAPTSTYNLNLGPTGMHGWMYHHAKFDSSQSRQILINSVDVGSPADGFLAAGDVILGVDGTGAEPVNFASDARKALAQAIADAEARNPATMKLIRWRAGSTTTVVITLRTMGSYSTTAPYNCPKSEQILEEGLEFSMNNEGAGRYGFRALALLAANDPSNLNNAARQAQAQADVMSIMPDAAELASMTSGVVETNSKIAWKRGHQLVVLAEYYLATGDTTVLPAIEAHAISIAHGQSMFGTVGHQFALQLNGGEFQGPYAVGYGPVNNAGMPCFLGLLLAKQCGLTIPELDPAIERASRFFAYYASRGTIPYGEHAPVEKSFENNGKSGLAALAFSLQPNRQNEADFYARMATAAFGDRQGGHTGSYFNELWAPLGANVAGEDAAAAYFSHISWLLDLNRRWDGGFEWNTLGGDGGNGGVAQWNNFYMSTAALLTYALPLNQLHITGRDPVPALELSPGDLADTVFAGEYDATTRTSNELLTDLANWAPAVQVAAAKEIGARISEHATLLPTLTSMANDTNGTSRVGACRALGQIADDSSAPVLAALLTDADSEVRRVAANAMRYLGDSAKLAMVNTVLAAAVSTSTPLLPLDEEDPLHFGHYNLCMLLFYPGSALGPQGMIKTSNVDTIDRNFLYPAIRAVAAHPVGLARNSLKNIFASLNETDLLALADVVVDTAHIKAPADAMFGDAVRVSSIEAMRNHGFAEGVPLSKIVIEGEQYVAAAYDAMTQLQLYAGSSKTVRPDPDILGFCENLIEINKMTPEAQAVIDAILADPNPTPLNTFKVVQSITADSPTLTLPVNSTTLRATTFDYAMGEGAYYTWRKIQGKGNASFSANGTAAAIHTTVTIDPVPGQYLFEVTMSDARGFTETTETVAVTLRDFTGSLPPNDPPVAYAQSLIVPEVTLTPIYLTGGDPEGYPLVYTVTSQPVHGTLTGSGSEWVYAPFYPHPGTDSFTFQVMDSEGQTASATVSITVADPGAGLPGVITWGTPSTISGPSDVVTTGTLAQSWTGDNSQGNFTLNGVLFSQGRIPGFGNSSDIGTRANDTGNTSYDNFIDLQSWSKRDVVLTGLTIGRQYLVQAWYADDASSGQRNTVLDDGSGNTVILRGSADGTSTGKGQWVTGTFTAAASSQAIDVTSYNDLAQTSTTYAALNGLQLRLLPLPADGAAPVPNPMGWANLPVPLGEDAITMTSATARDNSGTEYYFACTSGGGNDSGWQYSPTYTDTGLTPGAEYTYTVQARDRSAGQNTNIASAPASVFTEVTDVLAPPSSSFATGPKALSESIITMTAASVMDPGGVQYFFDETSGNPGSTDSGWQDGPIYTDTGLSANTTYTYTVTTRDKLLNTGTPSAPAPATTDPADGTAPATPGFESAPAPVSSTVISMTASYVSDLNGVEYYFTCTSGGGNDSGWQNSRVYIDTGLSPETPYAYTVTARDKSIAQNPSGASAPLSATTPAAVIYTMAINDVGGTAPATDIFLSSPANGSNTKVENITGSKRDRGQTFITPDTGDANTQWGLTAITMQLNDMILSSGAPVMNLQIVNWGPDTQAGDPGTVIFNENGQFPSGLGNGDYFTFELGETVTLNENGNYAFLVSFDSFGDTIKARIGTTNNSTYADGAIWGGGTSMTPNQDFTFYLKGTAFGGGGGGNPPPTPGFASGPVATSPTSVSMSATTVTDPEGSAVQYYFTCTAGGGNNSGWQSGTSYTDTGLTPDTPYSYTVKARDASGNESAPSAASSAITSADSNPPPTPGFASGPTAVSSSAITMTATSVTDPEGSAVEYYFTCTAGGGSDSGWQSGTSYTNTGLSPNTEYSYTVKAKDAAGNQSAPSAAASATTSGGGTTQLTIVDSGATAPGTNIFLSAPNNNQTTRVSNDTPNGDQDKGQTFVTPDTGDTNTQWGLTKITLQLADYESSGTGITSGNPILNLKIYEWGPDALSLTDSPGLEIYNQSAAFPTTLSNNDYFTFDLGQVVALDENSNYAFLVSLDSSGDSFRLKVGNGVQALYAAGYLWTGSAFTTSQDLTFHLEGTPISGGGDPPYTTWASTHAPGQTPEQDFDLDGMANGIEFVIGGTKDTNDLDKLPTAAKDGANMTFTFKRAQASIGGAAVNIEVGNGLTDWPTSYPVPGGATADNPGVTVLKDSSPGFDTVILTLPMDSTSKFARLKVVVAQ